VKGRLHGYFANRSLVSARWDGVRSASAGSGEVQSMGWSWSSVDKGCICVLRWCCLVVWVLVASLLLDGALCAALVLGIIVFLLALVACVVVMVSLGVFGICLASLAEEA
jgi:hypothetical protein